MIIMIITYSLNNNIIEGYEQTQDCIGTYVPQYSACSKTCGGGTQVLKFNVDIDPVSGYFRGNQKEPAPCPLDLTRECNTHNCPIDCKYVGGGDGWSNWIKNLDSNEKQIGTETRTREIMIDDKYGGIPCGNLTETRDYVVDCVQSAWSNWGACSNTCGGGTQLRTRSILQEPKNTDKKCGESEETQSCNTQGCPVDCVGNWEWLNNTCNNHNRTKIYKITTKNAHGGKSCPTYDGEMVEHAVCRRHCTKDKRQNWYSHYPRQCTHYSPWYV